MIPDCLKLIHEVTDTERNALKKTLQERKQQLQEALRAVDQGLKALAKKPKKTTAKRRRKR